MEGKNFPVAPSSKECFLVQTVQRNEALWVAAGLAVVPAALDPTEMLIWLQQQRIKPIGVRIGANESHFDWLDIGTGLYLIETGYTLKN